MNSSILLQLKWIKYLLNFIIEEMSMAPLQLWLMGRKSDILYLSQTQEPLGPFMCVNMLKGCLLYQGQTNTLNQLKIVVFLACNGGETGHRTSCLLPGSLMGVGNLATNKTTTNHWVFKMATWFTISALQPILVVLLTSVLMVRDSSASN